VSKNTQIQFVHLAIQLKTIEVTRMYISRRKCEVVLAVAKGVNNHVCTMFWA